MKPLPNSSKHGEELNRPVMSGQRSLAPQTHLARPTQTRGPASSKIRPQPNAPAPAHQTAIQSRGALPRAPANRPGVANNQHGPNRTAPSVAPKAPNYHVQAAIHLGGRRQQLRVTIQGTPQVAGSVEISAAGPGKAYISNLKVDQQHRRRGVAAKLIDAAINTARRQGFSAASLEARPSDNGITPQTLVAMYRRKGFKSIGKSGRGSPLMERKL